MLVACSALPVPVGGRGRDVSVVRGGPGHWDWQNLEVPLVMWNGNTLVDIAIRSESGLFLTKCCRFNSTRDPNLNPRKHCHRLSSTGYESCIFYYY